MEGMRIWLFWTGDILYISIFTVLGLRINEIVALLLYYCLSSLYRLTHPGQ
jgi:hypothetical protein